MWHRALVGRMRQILWWLAGPRDIRPQRSGNISLSQWRWIITKGQAPSTPLPTSWYHDIPPKRKHHPAISAIHHCLISQNKTRFWELGRNVRGMSSFSCWSLIEWFYPEDWLLSEWSKDRGTMRPAWPLCESLFATGCVYILAIPAVWPCLLLTVFQTCELPSTFQWIPQFVEVGQNLSLQFPSSEVCTKKYTTGSSSQRVSG